MELLPSNSTRYAQSAQVFRRSAVGDFAMALLFALFSAAVVIALFFAYGEVHPFLWWGLSPVALVVGLLFAVIAQTSWGAFVSGLGAANWLARVGPNGLHLNLRSHRNRHFEASEAAVLFLSFGEIQSVGKVVERHIESVGSERRTRSPRYVELVLAGVDTDPIAQALRTESRREPPMQQGGFVNSSTKHHDVPVFCEKPGVLRVLWHRPLFRALTKRVAAARERRTDFDPVAGRAGLSERVGALLLRGDRLGAIRLLHHEGKLELGDAKAWLEKHDGAA